MEITKIDGEREPFSSAKFCLSIRKAGAPREIADSVCKKVTERINPGDSTTSIFRNALTYLIDDHPAIAARYSLRRALEALGPAGFVFEKYIEAILQSYGFETRQGVMVKGHCLSHEIDVIGWQGSKHFLIEAKYHNQPGIKTHVDVVMYADARLQDIAKEETKREKEKYEHGMWLITNTKFTDHAITYAKCRSIRLTGWNYPRGASLEDVISQKRLYPVTILPSLTNEMLPAFAAKGVILAQDLLTYDVASLVATFGIPTAVAEKLVAELAGMVGPAVQK